MPIISPGLFEPTEKPELLFGLVAPVGTPLKYVQQLLGDALAKQGYHSEIIRLSNFLKGFSLSTEYPGPDASDAQRLSALMSRGNELRECLNGGEALALLAAAEIAKRRPEEEPGLLPGQAFIISQLKHPDEVVWLRRIYGGGFHLIGVHCAELVRRNYLHVDRGISDADVNQLIERDHGEESEYGQQVAETFHRSDVFVELTGYDLAAQDDLKQQIDRYVDLLFGNRIITPTRDEYGMFFAHSAALRSADLSRQVGAAILHPEGTLVSVGTNEVPRHGGGQYWADPNCKRDVELGYDPNQRIKTEALIEILRAFQPGWNETTNEDREKVIEEASQKLSGTRLMSLTEFNRAVHAEMEAILVAARLGISIKAHSLYTTTFPCHNCAKHIVAVGIERVVYIEPYPKSLAERLHNDSISRDGTASGKVNFCPFRGVSPRMYPVLFSTVTPEGMRIKRKNVDGNIRVIPTGLRVGPSPFSHVQREALVALAIQKITDAEVSG